MQRFAKRDWGWWCVLWHRPRYKVKLLRFKKGKSISLQRHEHRSELWLFLKGRGLPICTKLLPAIVEPYKRKGDYLLIAKRKWHKFTAVKTTWILEIQFGDVCVESDIERKDENI